MRALAGFVNAIYWLGLIIWISALVSAAVAAMNVFPTIDRLAPVLPAYAAAPEAVHPRLASGHVMEGVFFTADLLQFSGAALVLLALVPQSLLLRGALRRVRHIVRIGCLAIAVALLAWHATLLAPRMNVSLRAWWESAEQGRMDQAETHRSAFQSLHPSADAALRASLLLLVIAAVASAGGLDAPQPRSPLEIPTLRRKTP